MVRYLITLEGRVQGVGLRYFVQCHAREYGLSGWVKNVEDGSVQIAIQGREEDAARLMQALRQGNGFLRVDHQNITSLPVVEDSTGFLIL